jgi:hypothetical protein
MIRIMGHMKKRDRKEKTSRNDQEPATQQNKVGTVTPLDFPPPNELLEQARGETNRKLLQEYAETIRLLRDEKGFSFREIGDWLTQRGIEANNNDVYRVYTKGLPDHQVEELENEPVDE